MAILQPKIGSLLIIAIFVFCGGRNTSIAQTSGLSVAAGGPSALRADETNTTHAGEEIDKLLTRIAFDSLPEKFEDTKDWGEQSKRWDGIKWRREGLKIESSRRWKMVNHGTWQKYSATMRNPEEEFSLQIKNMHETDAGKVAFEIHVAAHLNIVARQSQWVKGVQLYSVNAEGHAKVRLRVSIEMDVRMGVSRFPPDIIMIPKATAAKLEIDQFRIDRISKVGGEVAQQISKRVEAKLDDEIVDQEKKIVAKINKQLDKKREEFRLSVADAMKSRWTQSLGGILPGLAAEPAR